MEDSTIEIETKFELDPNDFERLLNNSKVVKRSCQRNVYFDNDWRLANLSATCRIRVSSGNQQVITLKVPISFEHGRRVMREYHRPLAEPGDLWFVRKGGIDVDTDLPPEMATALLALGVNALRLVGETTNERFVLEVDGGAIELDRLHLPDGQVVYEVEIESQDQLLHDRLVNWVRSSTPNARLSSLSKFQRLRAALHSFRSKVAVTGEAIRASDAAACECSNAV